MFTFLLKYSLNLLLYASVVNLGNISDRMIYPVRRVQDVSKFAFHWKFNALLWEQGLARINGKFHGIFWTRMRYELKQRMRNVWWTSKHSRTLICLVCLFNLRRFIRKFLFCPLSPSTGGFIASQVNLQTLWWCPHPPNGINLTAQS